MRVNYTTYDMRRDQDTINPRTHSDVMVLSPETGPNAHRYWYARVLGIFHAQVLHTGPDARNHSVQHMEFLWVRWFGMEPGYRSGFKAAKLPKIGFVPETDESAFGFLDPSLVIRSCHIVPAFAAGRTNDLLSTMTPTAARPLNETSDWANFYVIIWVDRDMFMRYFGGGIGHVIGGNSSWDDNDIEGEDQDTNESMDTEQLDAGENDSENDDDDEDGDDDDEEDLEGEDDDVDLDDEGEDDGYGAF